MSHLRERGATETRPLPDQALLTGAERSDNRLPAILRMVGAIAVLVVGAVHLQQYLAYEPIPVIGPLFVLDFAGATMIGLGLLISEPRVRRLHPLLAFGGIGLAATSIVFLFISEHQPLFGFHEHGYRAAIVIALAAEAVTVVALVAYLATRARGRT